MKLIVDEEKLYELLKDFHQLTKLKVSFSKDYDTPILGVPHISANSAAINRRIAIFTSDVKKAIKRRMR